VDLYMLHGAAKDVDELRATWRALEAAVRMGKIRWLGVSNFDTKSIEALLGFATVAPAVVQNKMDVYHQVRVVVLGLGVRVLGVRVFIKPYPARVYAVYSLEPFAALG
jgi:diketogulonate reductase-like aldo/keto reductase